MLEKVPVPKGDKDKGMMLLRLLVDGIKNYSPQKNVPKGRTAHPAALNIALSHAISMTIDRTMLDL